MDAEDVLAKSKLPIYKLARAVRMLMARHRCTSRPQEQVSQTFVAALATETIPHDRRRSPRLNLTRPMMAIPILPEGSLGVQRQTEGSTIEISKVN